MVRHSACDSIFTFLTGYEIAGSFDNAWRALRAAVDGGHMTFFEWFGGVESQGWRGTPIASLVASTAA